MKENCAVFKGHCSFEVAGISKEEQQELNAVHKKWDEIAKAIERIKIGGVLYFKTWGIKDVGGTVVGVDESGSYATIFYGNTKDAEAKAIEIINNIKMNYYVDYADFVSAEMGDSGCTIKEIEV